MPAWKGVGGLRDLIVPRLYEDKEAEILVVGCGNSGKDMGLWLANNFLKCVEVSEKMYEEGYHYITNADFSGVIIEEMRERNAHLDEMDCKCRFYRSSAWGLKETLKDGSNI